MQLKWIILSLTLTFVCSNVIEEVAKPIEGAAKAVDEAIMGSEAPMNASNKTAEDIVTMLSLTQLSGDDYKISEEVTSDVNATLHNFLLTSSNSTVFNVSALYSDELQKAMLVGIIATYPETEEVVAYVAAMKNNATNEYHDFEKEAVGGSESVSSEISEGATSDASSESETSE